MQVFLGALFFLLAVTAFGLAVFWGLKKRQSRRAVAAVIVGVVMTVVFVFVPFGFVQVDAGEMMLVKEWGKAKNVTSAGLQFVNIVSQSTEKYSVQTQQIDQAFEAYSLDAQSMQIKMAVQYTIDGSKIIEIANTYGSQKVLQTKIEKVIEEKAKTVLSTKSAMVIIETRGTISPLLLEAVKEIENHYYITVNAVIIYDITFNDAFENAVEQKMIAEQEKLKAQYDKERAIIKAEEQLEVAKKEAEAAIAKSEGDAEALVIMQNAWSSLSKEVKDAMLRQMFYEKWNGELPQVMSDGSLISDISGGSAE